MLRSLAILGRVEQQPQRSLSTSSSSSSAAHVLHCGALVALMVWSAAAVLPVSDGFTLADGRVVDGVDLLRSWKPPPQYADIVDGIRQQQQQLRRIEEMGGDGGSNGGNALELNIADLLRSSGYGSDRRTSGNDEDDNAAAAEAENKAVLPVAAAVLRSVPSPPTTHHHHHQQQQQQHNNAKRQFKDASIGFPKTEARNMIRALINLRRYR